MDFLEKFDEKAKEKNWLNFLLSLLEYLEEELKWISSTDDAISETYNAYLPIAKGFNADLKIIISIIRSDDIYCTINVEYHEDISLMSVCFLMEENKVELVGFYRFSTIKAIIVGKENEIAKSKFKDLHNKLINLRLNKT